LRGWGLRALERAAVRRLQLRFAEPELEHQFRVSLVVALSTVLGFTVIDHWLAAYRRRRLRAAARQYPA
jgi:hypothetical protein